MIEWRSSLNKLKRKRTMWKKNTNNINMRPRCKLGIWKVRMKKSI